MIMARSWNANDFFSITGNLLPGKSYPDSVLSDIFCCFYDTPFTARERERVRACRMPQLCKHTLIANMHGVRD